MPQNNPMTELKTLLAFDNGYAIVKCRRVEWGTVDSILSKLIRATLEAAADRFCKICPGPGCPGKCKVSSKSECGYWRTILEPLPNPDEIECATLDEVNHRRGFN